MIFKKTIWSAFKVYAQTHNLSIQYIDDDDKQYNLYLENGNFSLNCIIFKEDPKSTDQLDFETNYLSNSNALLKQNVITAFETRDKTLKLAHGEADVAVDGSAIILIKVPGTFGSTDGRWISSGSCFFDIHTPGDKVMGVYFTDEDNLLGMGVGVVVASYTDDEVPSENKGWIIPPTGFGKAESVGGYGFAPAGFYMKVIGQKYGNTPSGKFYCNFEWAKVE